MKCSQDIKFDIIDKIGKDLTEGGLFHFGSTRDTLLFSGSENTLNLITTGLNKMFKEDIISTQKTDVGLQIKISPSEALAEKYLRQYRNSNAVKATVDLHNEVFSEEQSERDMINSNTGQNTDRFVDFSGAEDTGVFTKFLRHKERLRNFLNEKLNTINKELKDSSTTVARRTELNDLKHQIKVRLEGDVHRNIKGIEQEIRELKTTANIDAVGYYIEQDLKRLEVLASSNNASDVKEAQTIIEFYDAAGTFTTAKENPFFEQNQMFFYVDGKPTSDTQLGEETMRKFREWRNRAMAFAPAIDLRAKEVTVNTFNADRGVQRLAGDNGSEFDFDAIVHTKEGLKDIDWVSAWAMDVTQAIFSKSAELAQVMHTYLVNAMERNLNWSRHYAQKMEEITPKINKKLSEINGGKYKLRAFGIIGVNGVSYDLFLDKTKTGKQTGTLIQRFTKEYADVQAEQRQRFRELFEKARLADESLKAGMFNHAFEQNKQWKRANTVMMNVSLIPEIANLPEFAEFNTGATPEAMEEHKKELLELLGERGYEEQVEIQVNMLNKFIADRQSYINSQLIFEGVENVEDLTSQSKFVIDQWNSQHSPLIGIQDYFNSGGVFVNKRKINSFMDYNNTIPRKFIPSISSVDGKYTFSDTGNSTGFYNADFQTIEGDEVLREFYDLVKEGNDKIRESAPYELQKTMVANTLPMLMKSTAEFLIDNRNGTLAMISAGWRRLMERIRLSFGLIQQSQISHAVKDPITGRYNYRVNDQFLQGNYRSIKERMEIEKIKFSQALGINVIKRFTRVPFSQLNSNALAHLAQLLGVDITMSEIQAGKVDAIKKVTGDNVEIGKIIRDFSVHSVVQSQSFDLPKLMKHFTNLAMAYSARVEALPVMEIMKAHYEQIKDPKTNNVGVSIFNVPENAIASEGTRKNAIDQMEDWFQRVMLDNYGIKHWGVHGNEVKEKKDTQTGEVSTNIPFYGKRIYSNEEKKKIKEIDKLLSKEKDPLKITELRKIKEGLGKVRTASASIVNFLSLVRTLGLGWNLSSAITNFAEGYTSNMILASTGEFFDPAEIFYGYSVGRSSWVKNMSFGLLTTNNANKGRKLMDRYNVLLDSKNELQKSTTKTNLSRLEALNPHEINARVEYVNQLPIMVAMLRSQKIKDVNGNEAVVWDVMDKNGNLIGDFRTEENVANWETLQGSDYLTFKNKLNEAIVRAHGNYDELRGMMAKSNLSGKALMMFKTWLPAQLYWRFAQEQSNLKTGGKVKGRYRSFTPGSATVFGMGIGFVAFGPVGVALGGLGYLGGKFFGVQTELGALKEMIMTTQALVKKGVGMPINMVAGRAVINTENDFTKWVGSGEFTRVDAKNLRGNMAELAILMTTLAMMLLVKGFFWDDDDTPDDPERQFHNAAVNKLMQLAQQATMYVNPSDTWNTTFGSIALWKFLDNCAKEVDKMSDFIHGYDPGGEKFSKQTMKFLPGMFKDGLPFQDGKPGLGFNTVAQKQFKPSPFDDWFKSEEVLTAKKEKLLRSVRSEELKRLGYTDAGQRTKILNIEMPTTKQLNKKGVTREEWNEIYEGFELPEPIKKENKEEKEEE